MTPTRTLGPLSAGVDVVAFACNSYFIPTGASLQRNCSIVIQVLSPPNVFPQEFASILTVRSRASGAQLASRFRR